MFIPASRRILACLILLGALGMVLWPPVVHAQVVRSLAPGVWRLDANDGAAAGAVPSMSFENPRVREMGQAAGAPCPVPVQFETVDGRHSIFIPIQPGTSLYGTGEVPGPLLRNGHRSINWNTDAYGYQETSPSLYQSHPWVLAVREDGTSFGVLADSTYRSMIDLSSGIRITADGPAFPVIIIDQAHPAIVLSVFSSLVGRIELPPKWALGYHQCRYSYYPEDRVREIAREFRDRRIPCDVIWMDIDYMDGFRCFTFSPKHFPEPRILNSDLHAMGFHTVWMIDPGIKAEPGYFVFDQGAEIDAWVHRADGSVYQGEVWPGMCVFPDYTSREVRQWWAGLYPEFMSTGIDGVWNDMNEPAVFNVATKTMPEDNLHRADEALGGPADHARFHNVYGMLMVRATREGIMAHDPNRRPFVLSRANFTGGHRYAASWTGDNVAEWKHLEWSIPMVLNLGLSGQPFCGPDIGGFAGNGDGPMFARWMGVGALLPFARGHTGKDNIDKEPWSFGPEIEATCRQAIERRYRLMPYIYTLFEQSMQTGIPVARPLFFHDPADPALRSEDDAFTLGSDVLVAARVTPERDRVPVMPQGRWHRFGFDDLDNPDLPDLYLRAGAIVPTEPVRQHIDGTPADTLELLVALDEQGQAVGTLYEDSGDGWSFREDGAFGLTVFGAAREGNVVRVGIASREGRLSIPDRTLRVRLFLDDGRIVTAEGVETTPLEIPIQP